MAEYIERKDVLRRFTFEHGNYIPEVDVDNFPNTVSIKDIRRIIREISAADVAPVRHGKWTEVQKENIWGDIIPVFECSLCGKYIDSVQNVPDIWPSSLDISLTAVKQKFEVDES